MNGGAPRPDEDPAAWRAYLAEGNRTQPRKRVAADVLLRDAANRILLVDPQYKPDWDLPGGMAEANEPPDDTVRRELQEELGLKISVGALLCVDWVAPRDPWDDQLAFIFDGGQLHPDQLASLRPRDAELAAAEFCTENDARGRLRSYVWRRVAAALDASRIGTARYLRNGYPCEHPGHQ